MKTIYGWVSYDDWATLGYERKWLACIAWMDARRQRFLVLPPLVNLVVYAAAYLYRLSRIVIPPGIEMDMLKRKNEELWTALLLLEHDLSGKTIDRRALLAIVRRALGER